MIFGDSGTPKTGPGLVGQFWGLDSDRILKLVLREIILSQEIQMPPGGRRPMGHRLQQFLSFGRIIDLGEFDGRLYAAAAPASVPPSDADLLDVQRPHRRTDSADFRPRKQKESRGLPTPVTRIGR